MRGAFCITAALQGYAADLRRHRFPIQLFVGYYKLKNARLEHSFLFKILS